MVAESKRVAIIDYGMGNLRSVANAITVLGYSVFLTEHSDDLSQATHIILPGVGAFADGMANLQQRGWIPVLEAQVCEQKKPFLGICLGMQLLATWGTEHGRTKGLAWIPGIVERLTPNDKTIRIPHIGWNDAHFLKKEGLFAGLGETKDFYFVHSYALVPEDESVMSAVTHHGVDFVSAIEVGNIYATQFHPEKSQKAGLSVLRNFLELASGHA